VHLGLPGTSATANETRRRVNSRTRGRNPCNPAARICETVCIAFEENTAARHRRADAERNYSRIVETAVRLLQADPDVGLDAIAAAAGVGRATVYRHFKGRRELVAAARRQALDATDAGERDAVRPAGDPAGGEPSPLDVADVLNKVPPHLLGDQIVAEAQRIAGVSSVALYLVDIDGSRLLRMAGSAEFPEELAAPLAVGPEIPSSGVPGLRRMIEEELPGSVAAPLYLRGRAIGVLLAVRAPEAPLAQLARQAAAALELARAYTDVVDAARRRKPTSAAAEVQQATLPPRIARISGAALAGNVLPSYDVGGDWFDYAENPGGTWLGIADAIGKGAAAAALAAIALGAFRAARSVHGDLRRIVQSMHETLSGVGGADDSVAVTIARWHGAASTFTWITCGTPRPLHIDATGRLEVLGAESPPLGTPGPHPLGVGRLRLVPGDRIVLASDGILDRASGEGGRFGPEGIRRAAASSPAASASGTVKAIEDAVLAAGPDPLDDDATLIVLAPADAREG
jgi:serine phosphatase RsbU (regulator of sigma subunit)